MIRWEKTESKITTLRTAAILLLSHFHKVSRAEGPKRTDGKKHNKPSDATHFESRACEPMRRFKNARNLTSSQTG
jgi:hypothetical protein